MGWNPLKEAEKKLKKLRDEIESGVRSVGSAVEKDVKDKLYSSLNWSRDKLDEKFNEVAKKVEEKGKTALGEIDEAAEAALQKLFTAVSKEGLKKFRNAVRAAKGKMDGFEKKHPDLIDELNEVSFSFELGPATLTFDGFYDRSDNLIEALDELVNKPPEFRRGPLLKLIEALGPTTVDTGISVQVVALVVGSKELGIGGGLGDIKLKLFLEIGDAILEELGVPE